MEDPFKVDTLNILGAEVGGGGSNTLFYFLYLRNFQVEVTIAYGCTDTLSSDRILQYIHFNRLSNEMKITHLGKSCRQTPTS